jgi:hypothetical protein
MNTYGWNKIGDEVIFDKNTPNKIINKRVSVIVAVSRNEKINYKIHSDSVDSNKFSSFITSLIAKTDKKYFYLDNARIYHTKNIKELFKKNNISPIYGIPYNPQLDIAEYFFRSFKTKLRSLLLTDRININETIQKCWDDVNISVLQNSYKHVYMR